MYREKKEKMHTFKKTVAIIGTGAFTILILCSAGQAQGLKFGFKLTGGINYQFLGDGDAYLRGVKARTDDFIASSGNNLDQSIIPLVAHFGFEFDADAVLYLTPQFGVSLGTGYVRGGTLFGSGNQIITGDTTKETDSNDVAASAIPIKLGIYYTFQSVFVPTGKSSSYLFCGIGLYSATYSATEKWTYQASYSNYTEASKSSGIGFYGGWGSESWINPNFAFVFEIFGRYANIGGFKGDWQLDDNGHMSSGSGTLYYFEWLDSSSGNWYPSTMLTTTPPSGTTFRNVREAKIDFSGLGLRVGIKINF
jgi:hypothetical protein